MAKAEKGLSRRFQGSENGPHVHDYTCETKNSSCIQANVTPIRSMSMREKRLAELENGTNSLPRTYAGRCTSCTYCNNVTTSSCSPCYVSTPPMNMYPNIYVKVFVYV